MTDTTMNVRLDNSITKHLIYKSIWDALPPLPVSRMKYPSEIEPEDLECIRASGAVFETWRGSENLYLECEDGTEFYCKCL